MSVWKIALVGLATLVGCCSEASERGGIDQRCNLDGTCSHENLECRAGDFHHWCYAKQKGGPDGPTKD